MKIIKGNFNDEASASGQWVAGMLANGMKKYLQNDYFGLKWSKLKKGDSKKIATANKHSKTISILIYGKLKVDFKDSKSNIILDNEGDYFFLPPKTMHTWVAKKDSLIITLRWPPLDDQY